MKQASGKGKLDVRNGDDVLASYEESGESEEIEKILPQNTLNGCFTQLKEKIAVTRLGQMILTTSIRVLKVLEETAKWGLPCDENEIELQRPLPWILFLLLIVWLRIFRLSFSLLAIMVGFRPVTAISIVYYLQRKRRDLRVIRIQALKTLNSKETENKQKEGMSFLGNIVKLFKSAICMPGQRREATTSKHVYKQYRKDVDDDTPVKSSSKKPRYEEPDFSDLTVCEMMDKFAAEDSDTDSYYAPPDAEESDRDEYSLTSTNNTTTSPEEIKKYDLQNGTKNKTDDPIDRKLNGEEVIQNGNAELDMKANSIVKTQNGNHNKLDSGNEEMHTPKEMPELNNSFENGVIEEWPMTASKVAPLPAEIKTRPSFNFSVAPLEESNGIPKTNNETPTSLKPQPNKRTEKKSYRTITTQTAIELDWTITIKTEITHNKHYPKLERLKHSVNLTPASSTEDIFYSPTGSLQDFQTVFQPAPIAKGTSVQVKTSTPTEAVGEEGACCVSPGGQAPNQKKTFFSSPHKKHHHHRYYNTKNHNKNRR